MKLLRTLLEMNRDEAEAEARNMYGSLNHKAQSVANDLQRGYESDDNDGYTQKEWCNDWCNDHKEAVQTAIQLIQQNREEEATEVLAKADPSLEDVYVDTILDYVFDQVPE